MTPSLNNPENCRIAPSGKILVILILFLAGLSGCTVGPHYHKPEAEVPADWRWKEAAPRDEENKGPWWKLFEDSDLDRIQNLAIDQNQNLKAALARVEKAREHARVQTSAFYPNISANPSWQRYKTSPNAANNTPFPLDSQTLDDFKMPIDLSYEIDLWGKVRRSFESARSEMQASMAERENLLFSLQADVGENYYRLRGIEMEMEIFQEAVALREKNLEIFRARFSAGYSSKLEVAQSQTELASAKAQLANAKRQQASYLNTLALLCGLPPSEFNFNPKSKVLLVPPEVSPGIPSELLERRPDVAQAERLLQARNAEIGVAYSAFFPSIRLTGSGGFQSAELTDLFQWESRVWSFGPGITLPISAWGLNQTRVKEAKAAYEEAVANYRQSVLTAFKDVDDALASLRFLKEQSEALGDAAQSSQESAELSRDQFKNGVVDYLNVLDSERNRLENKLQDIRVKVEQMVTTIRLIKAIGGGWTPLS